MTMDMSDKDKEILEGTENLNLEIKPLGQYGEGEIGFSNKGLAETPQAEKPKQTPEDFWAQQKANLYKGQESSVSTSSNTEEPDENERARRAYRGGLASPK